jgi:hypothetical protein
MKEYTDTITLGLERNLILASPRNKNGELFPLRELSKSMAENGANTHSFGLFDTASPNFSNYYPEVSKQDLDPEGDPDGFVYPVFRALSMVVVRKDWDPVDFSTDEGAVLKESLPMLLGLSIYPNHEMMVGNELGAIVEGEWQDSYKVKNSDIEIPGGLNVRIKLDGKSNPKVARAVMMKPPSIHSSSVTVEFAWKQSHPDMEFNEFRSKTGTFDENGVLIRRMATKIKRYYEMSFVPHGADPFAQKMDGDKIVNPLLAHNRDSFSENFNGSKGFYTFSFKDIASYSEKLEQPENKPKPNNNTMKDKFLLLCAMLSIATEGLSEDQMEVKLKEELGKVAALKLDLSTKTQELATLTSDLANKDAKITELQETANKVPALETRVTELGAFETEARAEAERIYKLASPNKVDENTLTLIKTSSKDTLGILLKPYQEIVENSFGGKCNKCGSTEISRQSSESGSKEKETTPKSDQEVRSSFGNNASENKDSLWS